MKTYLVGGAVRDRLLNYPVKEQDWLVIGETPESMIQQGYKAVGKDFPVFLHPQSKEEYALARTERKTAPGYKGFIVHASPDVTLEQDLIRRDLTINAMAMNAQGEIFDPYRGQQDLQKRILRHVSPAFSEDPVRILRIARFAARYAHLGFTVAKETRDLMTQMVENGETQHLVAERVWSELHKALIEKTPSAFFQVLKKCGALAVIFPEINALFGIPQVKKYHPEVDTGLHGLLSLEQACRLSNKAEVRLAALLHDLGKAKTDPDQWPSHHGHEQRGLSVLNQFGQRLRLPKSFLSLASQVMRYHTHCHRIFELRASTITDMLNNLGAFKSDNTLQDFILACEADSKGRTGMENHPYPQAEFLTTLAQAAQQVDCSAVLTGHLKGAEIGEAIRQLRIKAIKNFVKSV